MHEHSIKYTKNLRYLLLCVFLLLYLISFQSTINGQILKGYEKQVVCKSQAWLKAQPIKNGEVGEWRLKTGDGSIQNPSSPQTAVSNLSVGHNYFYWQINSEGEITTFEAKISYDTIKPYAGQNAIIDFPNYELEANDGNISPGKWTVIGGSGTFDNITDPGTTVRGLGLGWNTYRRSKFDNIPECYMYDDVNIGYALFPVIARVKNYQYNICSDSVQLDANEPFFGTGKWQILNGNGHFDDSSRHDTWVRNLNRGKNRLRWTITVNGLSSWDDICIYNAEFDIDAGFDREITKDSVQLHADPALPPNDEGELSGSYGEWRVVKGAAVIEKQEISNEQAWATNLSPGENIFEWTVYRNYCLSKDSVTIRNINKACIEPNACFTMNNNRACKPALIIFQAENQLTKDAGLTYYWNFGDGESEISTKNTIQHIFSSDYAYQKYTVQLIIEESYCQYRDTAKQTLEIVRCE